MLISHPCLVTRTGQALKKSINYKTYVYSTKINHDTVPKSEENPFPKHAIPEVHFQLTCLIDFRVLISVLIINILKVLSVNKRLTCSIA